MSRATRPVEPFGFSLTPLLIAAGAGLLAVFTCWERRRETAGREPLVRLPLLRNPAVARRARDVRLPGRDADGMLISIPLYLQIVQGIDAFETGLRLLAVSVGCSLRP